MKALIYKVFLAPNWLHYEIALFFIVIAIIIVTSFLTPKADQVAIKGIVFRIRNSRTESADKGKLE